MFALALFALSVACLLTAPIAIAVALAVVVWGSIADVEVAVVVSRRRHDGARGQRVMGSIRMTPRKAIGALARTVGAAVETARRWTETARRAFGRWTETETAARWADRARAAADIGPAFGVLCAVWALPWIALAAPDGAAAAAGVCGLLAIARWGAGAGGLRFRADV
jgi:hypothetical protein